MEMTGYTKLFGSIVTSTIWREDKETKILWITMLALKNKHGIVEGSVPGLADMARLTLDETIVSLEKLKSPDPHSRTKDHEGRRIMEVDGGWIILNHAKWRNKMNEDERREYNRIKQQEHRAKLSKPVSKRKQMSALSAHTDADAYTEPKKDVGAKGSRPAAIEDWLKELEADPTYRGINIKTEYGKMCRWCEVHGKQATQRRFINWINKVDKPLSDNGWRPGYAKPYGRNYLPPAREPTEAELEAQRKIVRECSEALKKQLTPSLT